MSEHHTAWNATYSKDGDEQPKVHLSRIVYEISPRTGQVKRGDMGRIEEIADLDLATAIELARQLNLTIGYHAVEMEAKLKEEPK